MEEVAAPASAEDGFAIAEEVIGGAQARLVEQRARRESTQRYRLGLRMPQKAAESRCTRTRCPAARSIGIGIENRVAERELVNPRLHMAEAKAEVESQVPGQLPVVLREELCGVVGNVVDAVEGGFIVVTRNAEEFV